MFSKQLVIIVGAFILIVANLIALTISSNNQDAPSGPGQIISLVAPFQEVATHGIRFARDVWSHYFTLVSVAKERDQLKLRLEQGVERENRYREMELANQRLRELLNFQQTIESEVLAAEVIGKDPSPWFKTMLIDRGESDGVRKGLPVVVPSGIVGQIIQVAKHHAKVLLIIDQNSAVDALVQRTRSRGVVKGQPDQCILQYALRKHEINVGDWIVSSGLDGVFPKGFAIGKVSSVVRRNAGIFQDITVAPFVDFETIEEVLIVMSPDRISDTEVPE
jgi:rod shape-determining protein MreC